MAAPVARPPSPPSPMSQMLHSIGMTRNDLARHSDQMRGYLTGAQGATTAPPDPGFPRDSTNEPFRTPSTTGRTFSRAPSAADTSLARAPSPGVVPSTPVKAEPLDAPLPPGRAADSMEMVMERKSRQARAAKRARRERERNAQAPPSPSPVHGAVNMDSVVRAARHARRVSVSAGGAGALGENARSISNHGHHDTYDASREETPTRLTYQSHLARQSNGAATHASSSAQLTAHPLSSSLLFKAPTTVRSQPVDLGASSQQRALDSVKLEPDVTTPSSLRYYRENTFPDPRVNGHSRQGSSSSVTSTPKRQRQQLRLGLPPSSPPPMSSPLSSPVLPFINMVSSPGPMGPAPLEDDYADLPFKLPPGPYSTTKPELSYSALIGRAVLSSPGHRLTLQEIYEWITIVFPYYRRDEQTWMNSVRHVLSTTACFRKVPRERGEGKTQWAIWDRDLKCFENGGFDKRFCSDMPQRRVPVNSKKRTAGDDLVAPATNASGSGGRRKRIKKDLTPPSITPMHPQPMVAYPIPVPAHALSGQHGVPIFPAIQGHPYHQPYYQACIPSGPLPADIIFPPLPPSAALNQRRMAATPIHAQAATAAHISRLSTATTSATLATTPALAPAAPAARRTPPPAPAALLAAAARSLPMAAPSPPSSSQVPELTSDPQSSSSPEMLNMEPHAYEAPDSPQIVDLEEFVSFSSPLVPDESLEPGIELAKLLKKPMTPQGSPTLSMRQAKNAFPATSIFPSMHPNRLTTPPPAGCPRTPPPKPSAAKVKLSPQRTPLSHRGLHMSPSPSLAHYKSHLDPPAVYGGAAPGDGPCAPALPDADALRTPSRKRVNSGAFVPSGAFPPVTPKRLFPAAHDGGAPGGSGGLSAFALFGSSPFRTPGILDPHDPGALLDEELTRLGAAHYLQDSPGGGLLGSRALLYESPSAPSPGRFSRYW